MKIAYYAETDTLYIDLSSAPDADAAELARDLTVDMDADGNPVGIEIDHASERVDLSRLEAQSLPATALSLSGQQ